jgi:lambda family phage portal protein
VDIVGRAIAAVVGLFSPRKAMEYLRDRERLRSYVGAKLTPQTQAWRPKSTSAEQEIRRDWRRLTDRARDLERNNPYIAGLLRRRVSSVIGPWPWPRPKVRKPDGTLDAETNAAIASLWERWERRCGADGGNFASVARLVLRHLIVDGMVIVRRVSKPGGILPLRLQVLECDHLATDADKELPDGGQIIGGVEVDAFGEPRAFHLYSTHPAVGKSDVIRIPAEDIIFVTEKIRASQVTGACHYASVIPDIFDLVEYQDAVMTSAKVATAFGVFVKTPAPDAFIGSVQGGSAGGGQTYQEVAPGSVMYLRPGEEVVQVSPNHPSDEFADFVATRLRAAAVGAGSAYEAFSADHSKTSFSAARLALIQERMVDDHYLGIIESIFYAGAYRMFLEAAVEAGLLSAPGGDIEAISQVRWARPRREWVDPRNEMAAIERAIALGIMSRTDAAEERGEDFDAVVATLAAEQEMLRTAGVTLPTGGATDGADASSQGEEP